MLKIFERVSKEDDKRRFHNYNPNNIIVNGFHQKIFDLIKIDLDFSEIATKCENNKLYLAPEVLAGE